jgi:sigma-B regulation protein RsbU (phosphoserine phosphatase)
LNWLIVITVLKLAFGAGLLWLAVVVVRENRRSRINRITALMLFFAGLGPIFAAVGITLRPDEPAAYFTTQRFPYSLVYVWELFFPQLLLFALTFPVEHGWVARHRRLKLLIFLPHVVHVILMVFWTTPDFSWLLLRTDSQLVQLLLAPVNLVLGMLAFALSLIFRSHIKLFSLVNLCYIALAVAALIRGYSRQINPQLRDQVRVLIWGILSAVGLYAVAFSGPALGLYTLPYPAHITLFLGGLFIGAMAISWSIIRYQFLDIRLLVRESLVFTVSSALLVGAYLLLVTKVSVLIKDLLEIQSPLVDVAFVLLLLIFFQPLKDRIDDAIKRLFLRSRTDPRAILESFSRTITSVFDMGEMKQRITNVISGQLMIERAILASRDDATGRFRLELAGLDRELLSPDDPFFVTLTSRARPAAFAEFLLEQSQTPVIEILARWRCRLVVPVIDRGELRMVLCLRDKISGARYTGEDINLLATLANQMAVALTNVSLYRDALERQRLEDEMNVARRIQLQLLPKAPPQGASFQIAAFSHPSRQVGGDYYDFFELAVNRLGMVIADVSGKGLGAALLVSQLQAVLRSELRVRRAVSDYVASANDQIFRVTSSDQYATLVYAEFDPVTGRLEYSNAGHNYPVVVRADGEVSFLDRGGLVIGAFAQSAYDIGRVQLQPEDLLLFFTDGLSDLRDRHGADFGEERIVRFLRDRRHLTADTLKNELVREASEFAHGELGFDDLTMIVMKLSPPAT